MRKGMNRKCHWCGLFGEKCRALEEPVCKTGSCSFFETTAEFVARQDRFLEKMRQKRGQNEKID